MLKVAENAAWFAAFTFLVAFLTGMALLGSSQRPSQSSHEETSQSEQPGSNKVSKPVSEESTKSGNTGNIDKSHWYDRLSDWLIVLFTFCLVIANIYLYRSTDKSANAAKIAAEAARDAVDHADRNAATQLRAYVFMDSIATTRVINGLIDAKKVIAYQFQGKWKNVGQTPAVKMNGFTSVFMRQKNGADPIVFEVDLSSGKADVSAGSGIPFATGPVGVGIDDILAIGSVNTTKELFVASGVYYSDLFDRDKVKTEINAVQVELVNDPTIVEFNGDVFRYRAITDYKVKYK